MKISQPQLVDFRVISMNPIIYILFSLIVIHQVFTLYVKYSPVFKAAVCIGALRQIFLTPVLIWPPNLYPSYEGPCRSNTFWSLSKTIDLK